MNNSERATQRVLAIDPGRDKCGVAVVETNGEVRHQAVVATERLAQETRRLMEEHAVNTVVLGDRTAARRVEAALREAGLAAHLVVVDEHRSTEEGRRRYFQDNPRRGWRRLLPVSMQTPPRPYDDYVAVVLAERYLRRRATG